MVSQINTQNNSSKWKKLSKGKKTGIIVVAVIVVLGIAGAVNDLNDGVSADATTVSAVVSMEESASLTEIAASSTEIVDLTTDVDETVTESPEFTADPETMAITTAISTTTTTKPTTSTTKTIANTTTTKPITSTTTVKMTTTTTKPTTTNSDAKNATQKQSIVSPSNTTQGSAGGYGDADNFTLYDNHKQQNIKGFALNTSTKKFHIPYCGDVPKIKVENFAQCDTQQEAIDGGYVPCKKCLRDVYDKYQGVYWD